MTNMLDCSFEVTKYGYYIHFHTNTLWKGMTPLILSAMGITGLGIK